MVNRFPVAMEYIETNVKTLYESIDLMKKGHVDMARIRMILTTDNMNDFSENSPIINATSTIGGWLYYMRSLVKFDVLTNVTRTTCKNT